MTSKDVLQIAMRQSAIDSNCLADDFLADKNKVVISNNNPRARKYLDLPFLCDFTSYGNNIVASVSAEYEEIAKTYIERYSVVHCFETPSLLWLMDKLQKHDASVCTIAEYFLPNLAAFPMLECKYQTKTLHAADFDALYLPQWSNALCKERKNLDVLGVAAFDRGSMIALAACSADCDTMWQIGVDVLDGYRNQGIGASITNILAHEILDRGVVPFYCCAWSNIKSQKTALKSGFVPTWVQLTVRPKSVIKSML